MNVFLGCCEKKQKYPCKARDMYLSHMFKLCLKYATEVLHADHIYVLSAKYHIVDIDEVIEPYNLSLFNFNITQKEEWADETFDKMVDIGVDFDEPSVWLCGKNYYRYIVDYFLDPIVVYKDLREEAEDNNLTCFRKDGSVMYTCGAGMFKRYLSNKMKQCESEQDN